jgi:hypothetical protein
MTARRPAPPGLWIPRRQEDEPVRKTMLAAPMLISLALAPSASALPKEAVSRQPHTKLTRVSDGRPDYPVLTQHHRSKRSAPTVAPTSTPPQLQAIAACESGGNPQAVDSTGTYRGKYQFTTATWQGVGGSGDPAAAPEAEQDRRAAMLYARSGSGQWPVCGQ